VGFYLRKSISAGPFRFNLSGSGVGMSVGVKGFRIGTGPRGNYVHMGRGGLYYRASLGGGGGRGSQLVRHSGQPAQNPAGADGLSIIETGDVLAMRPSNGSHIVEEINQKMALVPSWPWPAVGGALISFIALGQPNITPLIGAFVAAFFVLSLALSAVLARWDQQRKLVVVMYDLDDEATGPFKAFTEEFDKLATVSRAWNIDAAAASQDWKRNAGAGRLVKRQSVNLTYSAPRVVKTNIDIPAIIGGRQGVYFLPDVALVMEGKRVGAVSYDQLGIVWDTTIFIEDEGVPADAEVVGHTWRFVNKNGGPDRRFNNNRQIPQVRYLQMGLRSADGLRKIIQLSRVLDHSTFDAAFSGLRRFIQGMAMVDMPAKEEKRPALLQSQTEIGAISNWSDTAEEIIRHKPDLWEFKLTVEVLGKAMEPVIARWHQLAKGEYSLPQQIVPNDQMPHWCQERLNESQELAATFARLVNTELQAAWGPTGKPGDAERICRACEDLADCAKKALHWEEIVRFTSVPKNFSPVRDLFCGIGGKVVDQIAKISDELCRGVSQENRSGTLNISLKLELPEHWADAFVAALAKASNSR
jgi:hypothetical protein